VIKLFTHKMICPNCKQLIDDDSIYCVYCTVQVAEEPSAKNEVIEIREQVVDTRATRLSRLEASLVDAFIMSPIPLFYFFVIIKPDFHINPPHIPLSQKIVMIILGFSIWPIIKRKWPNYRKKTS
jgi:hypothetical protein